jgi:hypothetical protein
MQDKVTPKYFKLTCSRNKLNLQNRHTHTHTHALKKGNHSQTQRTFTNRCPQMPASTEMVC